MLDIPDVAHVPPIASAPDLRGLSPLQVSATSMLKALGTAPSPAMHEKTVAIDCSPPVRDPDSAQHIGRADGWICVPYLIVPFALHPDDCPGPDPMQNRYTNESRGYSDPSSPFWMRWFDRDREGSLPREVKCSPVLKRAIRGDTVSKLDLDAELERVRAEVEKLRVVYSERSHGYLRRLADEAEHPPVIPPEGWLGRDRPCRVISLPVQRGKRLLPYYTLLNHHNPHSEAMRNALPVYQLVNSSFGYDFISHQGELQLADDRVFTEHSYCPILLVPTVFMEKERNEPAGPSGVKPGPLRNSHKRSWGQVEATEAAEA